jgi:dTDP-4-amino-4,6-dideoxygalactose transaminase
VTDDEQLYETAFGVHDQGHKPCRLGVEVGNRNVLGLNFRMNEITAAVGLAQLKKIDRITGVLHEKRDKFKKLISGSGDFRFRKLNDPDGDCATVCTVLFNSRKQASMVSSELGSKTVDQSGWHVYFNMEHVMNHLKGIGQPYTRGSYPGTDDILSRAMNISIGVVDGGLGCGWGININSSDQEIEAAAQQFIGVCK